MAFTEGHKLLREEVDRRGRGAQAAIARAVGRSEPAVSLWFAGSRPDGDARVALERELGIPMSAWSRKSSKRKRQG